MIEITNEDNMQLMARYPDNYFDLAIVDPPYGIDASLGGNGSRTKKYDRRKVKNWDSETPTDIYWKELFRISENQIIFGMNYFNLPPCKRFLVWDKKQPEGVTFAQAELIWTSFSGTSKIIKLSSNGQSDRIHPTQKPIEIYSRLLKDYAKEGFKLLDTHIGSGSIAIAVDNANKIDKMNLTLVGCELDKDYYNATMKRIKEQTNWQSLF
jgi:site-specific DNA-methyltransferase (adenine-specific)